MDPAHAHRVGSAAGRGLSRRTVVRVGVGAAWTAPIVTLATAAPAMAVSSSLSLDAFMASYEHYDDPAAANPHLLVVTASLGNSGPQTTVGLQLILTIPADLVDAITGATAPAGFTGPAITGSLAAGWSLVYTATTQIPSGGQAAFTSLVTLGSTTAAPYLGYRGSAFSLAATATAANANTQGGSASVDPTPEIWLPQSMAADIVFTEDESSVLDFTVSPVAIAGEECRGSIGRLHVTLSIQKGAAGTRLASAPTLATVGPAWTTTGTEHDEDYWVFTYESVESGFAGLLGAPGTHGPGEFRTRLVLHGGTGDPEFTASFGFFADHLITAWVDGIYPAPIGGS